jgi:hypothetical protein
MERVFPVNESGEEIAAEVTCPVPLPERMPPKVVLPVPPKLVARVEEPMTEPLLLVVRIAEATFEIARLVVVAAEVVALPETTSELPKETAPLTLRSEAMVVEPERYELPVVVAPPAMVRPLTALPPPIVEEACAMRPFDVVKKVEDAYGSVEERVVLVAVKFGAVTVPVKTPAPVTARGVPGDVVLIPTLPPLVTVKKVLVA